MGDEPATARRPRGRPPKSEELATSQHLLEAAAAVIPELSARDTRRRSALATFSDRFSVAGKTRRCSEKDERS